MAIVKAGFGDSPSGYGCGSKTNLKLVIKSIFVISQEMISNLMKKVIINFSSF